MLNTNVEQSNIRKLEFMLTEQRKEMSDADFSKALQCLISASMLFGMLSMFEEFPKTYQGSLGMATTYLYKAVAIIHGNDVKDSDLAEYIEQNHEEYIVTIGA